MSGYDREVQIRHADQTCGLWESSTDESLAQGQGRKAQRRVGGGGMPRGIVNEVKKERS